MGEVLTLTENKGERHTLIVTAKVKIEFPELFLKGIDFSDEICYNCFKDQKRRLFQCF